MFNNALILGSLPKTKKEKQLYEDIIKIVRKFAKKVKSPIDTVNFDGTPRERYEKAFKTVRWADVVIGEQSQPSTGQGMEIRECANLAKPLIVIAKTESKVSGLVKGCPVTEAIIYYDDVGDLENKLSQVLRDVSK
jgi:hypothetical protein